MIPAWSSLADALEDDVDLCRLCFLFLCFLLFFLDFFLDFCSAFFIFFLNLSNFRRSLRNCLSLSSSLPLW